MSDISETINKNCREILLASFEVVLSEDSKDAEFSLAVNSINTVLEYLISKRKDDER
jgi:hypothetical protein